MVHEMYCNCKCWLASLEQASELESPINLHYTIFACLPLCLIPILTANARKTTEAGSELCRNRGSRDHITIKKFKFSPGRLFSVFGMQASVLTVPFWVTSPQDP